MKKRKTYKYIIELTEEEWPRYLADKMTMFSPFAKTLVSIQDCQRSDHWYGENGKSQSDTYIVGREENEYGNRED